MGKQTENNVQTDTAYAGIGSAFRTAQDEADVIALSLLDKLATKYKGRKMTAEVIKEINAFQKANDLLKANGSCIIGESMIKAFPRYNLDANAEVREKIQGALASGMTGEQMRENGIPTTQTKVRANLEAKRKGAGGRGDAQRPDKATPDAATIALYVGAFLNSEAISNQDKDKLINTIFDHVDAYNKRVDDADNRIKLEEARRLAG